VVAEGLVLPARRRIRLVVMGEPGVMVGITGMAVLGVPAGRGLPALMVWMRPRRVVTAAMVLLEVPGGMEVPVVPGGSMPVMVVLGVPVGPAVMAARGVPGLVGLRAVLEWAARPVTLLAVMAPLGRPGGSVVLVAMGVRAARVEPLGAGVLRDSPGREVAVVQPGMGEPGVPAVPVGPVGPATAPAETAEPMVAREVMAVPVGPGVMGARLGLPGWGA